jgi:glycosyltransferase involved in cell wall biosynthesis
VRYFDWRITMSHERAQRDGKPIASVLIPVFNGKNYLVRAVDSVLDQTFTDFEVLLLDDGSSDGSREIMESFAHRDSRCQVHSWPNRGIVATLNAGLELAVGKYIVRMDCDDICAPDRFDKQVKFLEDNPEYVVVGSRVLWIDPDGMPLRIGEDYLDHADIDAENMRGRTSPAHPAATIRKDALERSGAYRDGFRHAEDLDLFLRLAEVGKVANLPDVLLSYRQHFKKIGHCFPEEQGVAARNAVIQASHRRGLNTGAVLAKLDAPTRAHKRWETQQCWGWWALASGHVATARKHAIGALCGRPLNLQNWQLAACVLRGR